jgi:hypothetical protein
MQDIMIKAVGRFFQLYRYICAIISECTSKIARVAMEGAKMAVILG